VSVRLVATLFFLTTTLGASWASAQESADALSTPRARDGSARPSGEPTPPRSDGLGEIPPPPPGAGGYATPRYAAPGATVQEDPATARMPTRVASRMRVLGESLQTLAARGRNGIVDGTLSLLSGALGISLGIYWKRNPDPATGSDRLLTTYLFLWGSANLARGVVDLALVPNASSDWIRFRHMPMTGEEEIAERLAYGEAALERIAKRTRLARVLDASLNIAVGVTVVPLYLGPNDFRIDDPFDYFVIIGSGISVITGIINLASRSEAERRWTAYEELRDRLEQEESARRVQFQGASVAPREGGATLNLSATF